LEKPHVLDERDLVDILDRVSSFGDLNLRTITLLMFGCCKREASANKRWKLNLIDKKAAKLDETLDIQTIVDMKTNVDILMRMIFNR
jgi:hypothetical protein